MGAEDINVKGKEEALAFLGRLLQGEQDALDSAHAFLAEEERLEQINPFLAKLYVKDSYVELGNAEFDDAVFELERQPYPAAALLELVELAELNPNSLPSYTVVKTGLEAEVVSGHSEIVRRFALGMMSIKTSIVYATVINSSEILKKYVLGLESALAEMTEKGGTMVVDRLKEVAQADTVCRSVKEELSKNGMGEVFVAPIKRDIRRN